MGQLWAENLSAVNLSATEPVGHKPVGMSDACRQDFNGGLGSDKGKGVLIGE
jgi:hypothetical protein